MVFDNPPEAPSESDIPNFPEEASAFIQWMQEFATEFIANWSVIESSPANAAIAQAAAATAANAAGYASTCATSVALTTGAKSIGLQTGKSFPSATDHVGWLIRASDQTIRIKGKLNPYNSGTGAATFTVATTADIYGSGGPYSDWIFVSAAFIQAVVTAAMVQAGTDATTAITPKALFDASAPQTLADGATVNWDMAAGWNAKVTLGGNRTMAAPTNAKVGITYVLEVIQDATGSRTITWNAAYDFGLVGAPTLSTGAGKRDVIFLYCYDAATPKFRASYSKSS